MKRTPYGIWVSIALLHGIAILVLWMPGPLHIPTKTDVKQAWMNASLYFERLLHKEKFEQAEQAAQAAAQKRIAELPPPLITRATPLNKVIQIKCPIHARQAALHGSVFLIADVTAQGRVGKTTIVEPSPNEVINQLIIQSFSKARFKPAIDAEQKAAADQIHFAWPYDCRK